MVDETDMKLLQEADFPDNADRDQCESAILEVYRYIKANGQASRDDIWSNVVLDTDKESAGRELCRTKGYVPKFRDWWWEKIVVPGLEALPDVERSNIDSNQWEFCGQDQYALSDWSDA